MSTKSNIKPGYQLSVISWENDGDNYSTQIIYGLSEAKLKFFLEVMSLFYFDYRLPKEFQQRPHYHGGNEEISDEEVIALIEHVLSRHPDVSAEIIEEYGLGHFNDKFENDWDKRDYMNNSYREILKDLLGQPGEYYENDFVRVADGYTVHFVPGEIEDVTAKFAFT